MRRFLSLLALLIAPGLAHADSAGELATIEARQKRCLETETSNAAMVECTDTARAAADKLLNTVYAAAVAQLKGGDDDARETLRRLVASERAWVAYRDAECQFQGASMIGGSGESLVVADCLYTKSVERVKAIGTVLDPK